MKRKRLVIIAEGQTEESFTNKLLKPHLPQLDIDVVNLQGGKISVESIRKEIKRLIHNYHYTTTFVDYYKFRNPKLDKSVDELEKDIKDGLEGVKEDVLDGFIPYIQKYEFEALIFSDLSVVQERFNKNIRPLEQKKEAEDINHNHPPSKILKDKLTDYDKVLDGVDILKEIGIKKIREKCPRFHQWIKKLESLR